jgi:uncharacterized protein (UPF0276 family)
LRGLELHHGHEGIRRAIARDALGLGLRVAHYRELFETAPSVGYFEIVSENFLGDAEKPRKLLEHVSARYPLVLHGVGLNLLGPEPPDERYLERLCRLADAVDAPFVTDHLCWTGAHGRSHHDLLPVPFVPELVEIAAERAAFVQARLGRPFGLENVSSYLEFERSTLCEWDFVTAVVRAADCGLLLDINNVYVSSENHGFSPEAYLDAVDYSRVLQVHLAGFTRAADGTLIDTHAEPVAEAVWGLYERTWRAHGPFPTLLEWDDRIPPLKDAVAELEKARARRA